jgi:hypothetical protein
LNGFRTSEPTAASETAVRPIIELLPFNPAHLDLRFSGGETKRLNHQIILWISLTAEGEFEPPDFENYFPAVFDTGFNDCLVMQESHFFDWARAARLQLPEPTDTLDLPYHDKRGHCIQASLFPVDVWLHRNVPRSADELLPEEPFRLELPSGVAVVPDSIKKPRIPVLGLRALTKSPVEAIVHGQQECFSLRELA